MFGVTNSSWPLAIFQPILTFGQQNGFWLAKFTVSGTAINDLQNVRSSKTADQFLTLRTWYFNSDDYINVFVTIDKATRFEG